VVFERYECIYCLWISFRCMYVSGVPGTGKTVIVQSVVDTLSRYANERKEHLRFKVSVISCSSKILNFDQRLSIVRVFCDFIRRAFTSMG
jgi:Cdc6-like AAA superfamily ATPase